MGYWRPGILATTFAVITILVFSLFVTGTASAQVTGATLSGTVKDASGSTIPGATVSIKNTATGIVREVTTDGAGFYTVPEPPASYVRRNLHGSGLCYTSTDRNHVDRGAATGPGFHPFCGAG